MPSIGQWLGLEKLQRLIQIVRQNGGIFGSVYKLYRMDDLKMGTLVGTDKFGNKYYENNEYFHGRNRWVYYSDDSHLDYDASQIPAEWHQWLHYTTDIPPSVQPPVRHKWMIDHTPNYSGTALQYVPYSTTRDKIQKWRPGLRQIEDKK
ncbi:probable NADH dehydrogenase [ubiquinone] 1 alpha subcomplex subunit 12 [Oppia nitens]|uniref:probable NADH dehydrogenase [ubiquinone] 1 alpha subcomplex subunit 12 n=1 Tax=Oppia nitens TaxID=1686743 RepID=UPI0023DB34B8|nr:probable NADH dehydrogenase [ubiquinone] 1 alpha subcomplex subunit 12 [Oppia nitens]